LPDGDGCLVVRHTTTAEDLNNRINQAVGKDVKTFISPSGGVQSLVDVLACIKGELMSWGDVSLSYCQGFLMQVRCGSRWTLCGARVQMHVRVHLGRICPIVLC